MCDLLNKDVLAPISTILASIVAAAVTIVFQRRQNAVSRNKLKLDMFDKKYQIYSDSKELISIVVGKCHDIDKIRENTNQIRSLYVSLSESVFFFSPKVVNFLKKCEKDCENFLMAISEKQNIRESEMREHGDRISKFSEILRKNYKDIPSMFESDLKIEA